MPIPDELAEAATALSQSAPSRVLLPAGCGKTHLLAAAATVKAHQGGRVLVLTHTHAGVDAMKRRIRAFGGVSGVAVGTLDGWMRRLVRAFPGLSAHVDTDPPDWVAIRAGALGLMSSKHVREMVGRSSDFVIVDEYQDCSLAQHAVVSVLAEEIRMPMVIAGDPLQAIYSFGDDQLIDWSADLAFAPEHDVDPVAWRWADHNEALGEQLLEVRHVLENQEDLDLRDFDQIRWIEDSPDNRRRAAWAASSKQGSVVVLERFAGMAVEVARMTKGRSLCGARLSRPSSRRAPDRSGWSRWSARSGARTNDLDQSEDRCMLGMGRLAATWGRPAFLGCSTKLVSSATTVVIG